MTEPAPYKNIRKLIDEYISEGGYVEKPALVFQFSGGDIDTHEGVMTKEILEKAFPDNKIFVVVNTNMQIFSAANQNKTIELYEIKAKNFDEFKTLLNNATKPVR